MRSISTILGATYSVESLLGKGGQGTVVQLRSQQGLAAKILHLSSERGRETLKNRIAFVRSLPLGDLPVALPIDSLAPPHVGYTMQLLRDMAPVTALLRPPKNLDMSLPEWYSSHGGLLRRLRLMAKSCDILSEIHSRGLCYGDVSPRNFFINKNGVETQVWFIDADNLKYDNRLDGLKIYTPGYGAPELISGRSGATTLSDAYSMAVIAFQCLTMLHPLMGDMVTDGPPELEEQALLGKLPWIEDEADRSNTCCHGVPREWVLSPRLRMMFGKFFKVGLNVPESRPGVSALAQSLHFAADFLLPCNHCRQFFYPTFNCCPWCEAPRERFLIVRTRRWEPSKMTEVEIGKDRESDWPSTTSPTLVLPLKCNLTVTARALLGASGMAGNVPKLRLRSEDGAKMSIDVLDDLQVYIGAAKSQKLRPIRSRIDEVPCGAWLHTGPVDTPHRILQFIKAKQNDAR
jgi:DNA-binding helix-hairpin-helix protein with protein kinase domain